MELHMQRWAVLEPWIEQLLACACVTVGVQRGQPSHVVVQLTLQHAPPALRWFVAASCRQLLELLAVVAVADPPFWRDLLVDLTTRARMSALVLEFTHDRLLREHERVPTRFLLTLMRGQDELEPAAALAAFGADLFRLSATLASDPASFESDAFSAARSAVLSALTPQMRRRLRDQPPFVAIQMLFEPPKQLDALGMGEYLNAVLEVTTAAQNKCRDAQTSRDRASTATTSDGSADAHDFFQQIPLVLESVTLDVFDTARVPPNAVSLLAELVKIGVDLTQSSAMAPARYNIGGGSVYGDMSIQEFGPLLEVLATAERPSPALVLPQPLVGGGFEVPKKRRQLYFSTRARGRSVAYVRKIEAVCSALVASQQIEGVEFHNATRGYSGATRRKIWQWISYALFSTEAPSQLKSVGFSGVCIRKGDVDAIMAVAESKNPVKLLLDLKSLESMNDEVSTEEWGSDDDDDYYDDRMSDDDESVLDDVLSEEDSDGEFWEGEPDLGDDEDDDDDDGNGDGGDGEERADVAQEANHNEVTEPAGGEDAVPDGAPPDGAVPGAPAPGAQPDGHRRGEAEPERRSAATQTDPIDDHDDPPSDEDASNVINEAEPEGAGSRVLLAAGTAVRVGPVDPERDATTEDSVVLANGGTFPVLRNEARSDWIDIVIPCYGYCSVSRAAVKEVVPTETTQEAPRLSPGIALEALKFEMTRNTSVKIFLPLIRFVGKNLKKLLLFDLGARLELNADTASAILECCPKLDFFDVNGCDNGALRVVLEAYQEKRCSMSTFRFGKVLKGPTLMDTLRELQDPKANMARRLTEVNFFVADPDVDTVTEVTRVLETNMSLRTFGFTTLFVNKSRLTQLDAFDKQPLTKLLDGEEALAFLSVLHCLGFNGVGDASHARLPAPKSSDGPPKRKRARIEHLPRTHLNQDVIGLIFAFAATRVFRRVHT